MRESPELRPNQCELTYVNHIPAGEGWEDHGQLERIVTVWQSRYSEDFLPEPEGAVFEVRYLIPGKRKTPLGRLYISFAPAFRPTDQKSIYAAQFVARGAPISEGIEGVFEFLDLGHEWIVRSFVAITSTGMHKVWGRR